MKNCFILSTSAPGIRCARKTAAALSRPLLLGAICLLAAFPEPVARGATYTYTGPDGGNWNTAANWTLSGGSTHAVPAAGDSVTLGLATTVSSVNFNATYAANAGLNTLTLDSPGHTSITLNQTTSSAMVALTEIIGSTVSGNFYNQSAGTNTVSSSGGTGSLILGQSAGSSGSYTIGGTAALIVYGSGPTGVIIGNQGTGSLTQTGGSVSQSGGIFMIGGYSGGSNSYAMSGGLLAITNGYLTVGYAGNGTMTQSAGTVLDNGINNRFYLGANSGASGTYALSGTGQLTSSLSVIGSQGAGVFAQSGGTATLGSVVLGESTGANGTYNLGAGNLSSFNVFVGEGNGTGSEIGVFNQSGGTHTATGQLYVSVTAGASGTYNLSGGTLSAPGEIIGSSNSASDTALFAQTGGTNTLNGAQGLVIGSASGSSGVYTLGGPAATTLTANQLEVVGAAGAGLFTQTGGTHVINADLQIGQLFSGSGTYQLNGGALNVPSNIGVGQQGIGVFNQTAGTASVGGGMYVGSGSGSIGSLTLSGGTLTIGNVLFTGNNGNGVFNQSGGTLTVSTGSNNVVVEAVGSNAAGLFNQTNGSHTVNGDLAVGNLAAAGALPAGNGTYNFSGGTLTVSLNLADGYYGAGSFNQSGGTNMISSFLELGVAAGAHGSYSLTGTGATLTNAAELVGVSGSGTFFQNGGTHTVSQYLVLANYFGSTGSFGLYGGTLAVQGGNLTVGNLGGIGSFSQGGGTNTVASGGALNIGIGSGYNLFGGALNVQGAQGINVAAGASLHESGSGTLNVSTLNNAGSFIYDAGTFNGSLNNMPTGTVTVTSPFVASAGVLNNGIVNVGTGASFGGGNGSVLDNENAIVLTGGSLGGGGTILNNGSLSGYGTIGGTSGFTNNFGVTQGAGNLVISNTGANVNNGTFQLAAARQLQLQTAFANAGTLDLNSGGVTGTGTLTNNAAGTISGPGVISAPFSNNGIVTPGAGTLNISFAWTNTGVVQLSGLTSDLVGGTMTNNGTVQGSGNVGGNVTNNTGTIEAIGGTLVLGGTTANASGGTIAASLGNKVIVSSGLTTNAGVLSLTGGTFDNNSHALNNTGEISGYGTFRSGGLTNAGSVTFTGGQTTVNGNVTNNSGQLLKVAYNPATFTGNVVNNGVIKTTATNVTFAGNFTNNGAFISDPSTQNFVNLAISSTGYLQGSTGDVFNVLGDVTNNSVQIALFNIAAAQLTLQTGLGTHQFAWPGADVGAISAGYTNNFAVGILELQAGGALNLADGNALAGVGIYVGTLKLDGGLAQISSITGNGADIYYDPTAAANAYLNDGTYALQNGGFIEPISSGLVPEPTTWAMLASGVLLGITQRFRRRA